MLRIHPAAPARYDVLHDFGTAGLVAGIIGSVVSAGGSLLGGSQDNAAAQAQAQAQEIQAQQLAQNAGQERAAAQQNAIEERRKARLARSRNEAVAAASGGSASDPTVLAINEGLAGQGEYNALTALYQGEARAQGLEADAAAARYSAKQARRAGRSAQAGSVFGATTSLLGDAARTSLMLKYG